jgi:eukaryotic-like serine/threonine-protein kinase
MGHTQEIESLVGQRHGPLIVERMLGAGAIGSVYLAWHPPTGTRFVLKVLHPHLSSHPLVRLRFRVEARTACRVVHPNVARMLDVRDGLEGRPTLLMEYVDGQPLSQLQIPLPRAEAVELLAQILDALEAAHARGVVHCDLKPDNIFLVPGKQGQRVVKVLDFGMASVLASCFSREELAAGVALGSPPYLAPEQWETTAVDTRMDVYAVGVIGYRLLTGRLPFSRGRMGEVLLGQEELRPPPPHVLNPHVPQALSAVLMMALSRRPEERFPSARAFRLALVEAMRQIPREPVLLEAAAPRAQGPLGLHVRVGGLGSPEPRPVRASDVTGEGLFVAFEGAPPPLAARVPMELSFQGRALRCEGDVVRHVSQLEASAWGVVAGFFVHFAEPSEELRSLIAQARASPVEPPRDAELAQLLTRTAALGKDPYVLLGLPPSASFEEVRQRADAALRRLEAFRGRPLPLAQQRELEALRARVEAARRTLGEPLARVGFDAQRGNAHGIARCIAAGVSEEAVEPLRRAFLAARPGNEVQARALFAQARTLEAQHALKPAVEHYAQALALDPLNLAGQRHYWALQRRMRPMTTTIPAVAS